MLRVLSLISGLLLLISCEKSNENKVVPSDLILIEFAAALEEEQDKLLPPTPNNNLSQQPE